MILPSVCAASLHDCRLIAQVGDQSLHARPVCLEFGRLGDTVLLMTGMSRTVLRFVEQEAAKLAAESSFHSRMLG
jgi:hypothetical protein